MPIYVCLKILWNVFRVRMKEENYTLCWAIPVVSNNVHGKNLHGVLSMTETLPKSRKGSEFIHGPVIIACPPRNSHKTVSVNAIPYFLRGQCSPFSITCIFAKNCPPFARLWPQPRHSFHRHSPWPWMSCTVCRLHLSGWYPEGHKC